MDSQTQSSVPASYSTMKRRKVFLVVLVVALVAFVWILVHNTIQRRAINPEYARREAILNQISADSSVITTTDTQKAMILSQIAKDSTTVSNSKTNPPLTNAQKQEILDSIAKGQ